MVEYKIKQFEKTDINQAIEIWNDIVSDGIAFPQTELLNEDTGLEFINSQSFTGIAYNSETNEIVGLYILHPNNVGRCGHISNASYAVKKDKRGQHIGELLVKNCLIKAKELGFKILMLCHGRFQECCLTIFRLCFRLCMGLRLFPYQTKRMSVLSDFKTENVRV